MKKNLKIAITPEQPLDEVVGALEKRGYRFDRVTPREKLFVYAYDNGDYHILSVDCDYGEPTTLTELKEME